MDVKSGTLLRTDLGHGPLQPRNELAVPGYGHPVVLSGDDTFTNNPAQSQLYSYIAPSADAVLNDEGDLWAFVSDTPGFDDYSDFVPGSPISITGHFVKVDKDVATGHNADGTELMAADKGYPLPPNDGTWQRDPNGVGWTAPSGSSSTGATSTTSSSSCASRISRTTSTRAWGTSSTSPTPAVEPRALPSGQVDERADLEDGARPG